MPSYTLSVLGHEISFKTYADNDRIMGAKTLLEERFADLYRDGSTLGKEKLLLFLALSLADDFLESKATLGRMEEKIKALLEKNP